MRIRQKLISRKVISFCLPVAIALQLGATSANAQASFQMPDVQSKTYLLNGLASAIPFIGYGMANLKKKIANAKLYSYISPVEGSAVIQPLILREIRSLYRKNRNIQINLVGISYGASMVTSIASILARDNIPVNYLGVIDGRPLSKVYPNVGRVDNFTCTYLDCIGVRLRVASGNRATQKVAFKFRSTHIALGNNKDLHNRIIQQISMVKPKAANQLTSRARGFPAIDNRSVGAIAQ